MAIALYMDHHVPKAITVGLRLRDVDVITAYEDDTDQLDDDLLLKRAHELVQEQTTFLGMKFRFWT